MKTIHLPKQENVKTLLFPDNQPHVCVFGIEHGDDVRVVAPIRSSLELLQLLEVSNALEHLGGKRIQLVIPYLMGARFDRIMQTGDSFDLQVVAKLINLCNFQNVNLFDAHSDVAMTLIDRCKNHNNSRLVAAYTRPNSVLICPDKGAVHKVQQLLDWNKNLTSVVFCEKKRDLSNGRITLEVLKPELCHGRDCVIIDDLCDGGGTFNAIAGQIKPSFLTLVVSHGIFSKGFTELGKNFQHIITSDSYASWADAPNFVTTIPLNL